MIRKLLLILITALSIQLSLGYALNLEVHLMPTRPFFYDNETPVLNLTIVNNELTFAAENAFVNYTVEQQTNVLQVGTIPAEKTVTQLLNLNRFNAGTYQIDYFVGYDFIGTVDTTSIFHSAFRIDPSKQITMKLDQIRIQNIIVPSNAKLGQEFVIDFNIDSSTDNGEAEIAFQNSLEKIKLIRTGMAHYTRKYIANVTGSQTFSIKAYSLAGSSRILEDFKSAQVVVSNPDEFRPIQSLDLNVKEGKVSLSVEKEPLQNLISQFGCFVSGCKSDTTPPKVKMTVDRKTRPSSFVIEASDDSRIMTCKIRIGQEWIDVVPQVGKYGDPSITVQFQPKSESEILHDPEAICIDAAGNQAGGTIHYQKLDCPCGVIENDTCAKFQCCSDQQCGDLKKCDLSTHNCIEKTGCIDIIKNGDSDIKADVLFIGDGYSDISAVKEDVLKLVDYDGNFRYNGLMSVEPFKSNRNKFNIWILKYDFSSNFDSNDASQALKEASEVASSKCSQKDYVNIISKKSFRSYCFFAGYCFDSISSPVTNIDGRLVLHEFGHGFGQLKDEYTENGKPSLPGLPNCAPDIETAKVWWSNIPGTGIFQGCSYTENNIRPTENSIMRSPWILNDNYGPVNEKEINLKLQKYW